MIISSDYSLGGRIMDIASWHKVISSVRTDSRVFVENTESVITGKDNTGRDKISIICSKETSEKITADIYITRYLDLKKEIFQFISPVLINRLADFHKYSMNTRKLLTKNKLPPLTISNKKLELMRLKMSWISLKQRH